MTSRARVKREPTATMKSTSRRSVSWQSPDRDDSLLACSRLDFGLAEGSAVARLRRELAEMRTKVDSICSQTNPQMDPQGQARRKGAARSEKANNIMSDHPPKPGAAMTDASAPANTSTSVIDHRLSKGTANHGSVGLIERGSQHNGEKSKKSSVPMSETTEGQPKSSTGTASIHIESATDHREGRTVIRPDALTHQQRKPVERERGNIFASSTRSSTNEQARLRGPDTPTRSQRRRVHLAATRANQAYATSSSHTSRTRHSSDGYWLRSLASRSDHVSAVSHRSCGNSFDRSSFREPMHRQRYRPRSERHRWSPTISSRPQTCRRDTRQNIRGPNVNRHVFERPRYRESKPQRLGLAPAAYTQRTEPSSSLIHGDHASLSKDGLVPAGLSVKSADTSKYPVTPRSHQAVDSDDVEALGWKHSEISECGQILEGFVGRRNV